MLLLDRIREVVAWYDSRVVTDTFTDLRSSELHPSTVLSLPNIVETNWDDVNTFTSSQLESISLQERKKIVEAVSHKRSTLLSLNDATDLDLQDVNQGGRILLYNPSRNHLYSGIPEVESHGFFDVCNSPPWDLWLMYTDKPNSFGWMDYLVSWVPAQLIEIADYGIQADKELDHCIVWADSVGFSF